MQLCFFCLGWGYLGGLGSPRNGFGLKIAEIRIMRWTSYTSSDNSTLLVGACSAELAIRMLCQLMIPGSPDWVRVVKSRSEQNVVEAGDE